MTSKKKDLEIVYNLEWKNKPANGDEKSNMVGILDIPATTLDWNTFKSYLLKNSGAADDNVKVSYIDTEDREKPIHSQLDFEIALYSFRQKARMGEIITLKLDSINSKKNSGVKSITKGFSNVQVKMKQKVKKVEEPPEWFLTYMKKFKEDIIEEMTAVYTAKTHQVNMHHARKLKAESYKRARKAPLLIGDTANDSKELSKSAKMERKLESKLEKLEHKTMKIKAKKMALRGSSDSDVSKNNSKIETMYLPPNTNNDMLMNASVTKKEGVPHMSGGEPYCQTWDICNSGTLPWTSDTELRYAWGSQALKPLNKEVPCPPLKPGEKGTISVFLEIPKIPGTYECYWHFYHDGRRFGHWLGCEIIVDESPVKNVPYIPRPTYDVINIGDAYELVLPTSLTRKKSEPTSPIENPHPSELENPFEDVNPQKCTICSSINNPNYNGEGLQKNENEPPKDVIDGKNDFLHLDSKNDMNTFSDSDNQSIVSISDSNSSVNSATSDDFVILKMSNSPNSNENNINAETMTTNTALNLTKMNVSSLEINNVTDLYSKLSLDSCYSNPDEDFKTENQTFTNKQEDTKSVTIETDFKYLVTDSFSPDINVNAKTQSIDESNSVKEEAVIEGESSESNTNKVDQATDVMQRTPVTTENSGLEVKTEEVETETNLEDCNGYVYISYKGQKIPISKKHLSKDFLSKAESVPESEIQNLHNFKIDTTLQSQEEAVNETSINRMAACTSSTETNIDTDQQNNQSDDINHKDDPFNLPHMPHGKCSSRYGCMEDSMTSSHSNENRFFVFPQYYPGYEVIPPMGGSYIEPNIISYQPLYRLNTVGEVIVNDWTTGLNYSSCVRYPNSPNQCCSPSGTSTPNFSKGCNTMPTSNGTTTPNQSPQSPPSEPCFCKVESHAMNNSGHGKCQQNVNVSSTFEDHSGIHTTSASTFSSHNGNLNMSNHAKQHMDTTKGSTRGVPDLLTGASVVASSAINTARSVLNMFTPPRNDCGRWQNGHWISTNPESQREKILRLLHEMGFYNRDLNATLLARYNDDINAVLSELLQ